MPEKKETRGSTAYKIRLDTARRLQEMLDDSNLTVDERLKIADRITTLVDVRKDQRPIQKREPKKTIFDS